MDEEMKNSEFNPGAKNQDHNKAIFRRQYGIEQ